MKLAIGAEPPTFSSGAIFGSAFLVGFPEITVVSPTALLIIYGAILIIVQPIEPSVGRDYIGRIFAICVLGGLGSFAGTLVAAIILGVMENLTATFFGPSWAPAVSFGFLLLTLAFRPSGIFGRA